MPVILIRSYANSRVWTPYARQPKSESEGQRLVRQLRREGRDVVLRHDSAGVTTIQRYAAVPLR